MSSTLSDLLLGPTKVFGLQLWVVICILVGILIPLVLSILFLWLIPRRRLKMTKFSLSQIPNKSKEIKVDEVSANNLHSHFPDHVGALFPFNDKPSMKESEKTSIFLDWSRSIDTDSLSQCSWAYHLERARGSQSDEDGTTWHRHNPSSQHFSTDSPSMGLPDTSRLGWGHWFTLRDLEFATNRFSKDNILGEGGYGVVYKGRLINGTPVAVKKIRNNTGQAENEFSVEVEAIGHVRHKNLVRLLGYCIEGTHRLLVYEYVNNGNLEEWLHGALRQHGSLSWEARLKVILGTAKGLAYLHDGIEPKVVHRDIKSGNILIDENFNAKVSDFGLAKLLGAGESHVATRVMGTLGYVAPEYANTGLLNEKSDVYSFGILLMEAITGRDPVDYGRPPGEENLVEWLKQMVGSRRSEEVVDPNLEVKPSTRALKRALLVAFRCIDPDSEKRPQMGQVVRMLEAADFSYHEDWRNQPNRPSGSIEIESLDHGS